MTKRIEINTDDGGPVDAEHISAVAAARDSFNEDHGCGSTVLPGPDILLAEMNKRLRACQRPARAALEADA